MPPGTPTVGRKPAEQRAFLSRQGVGPESRLEFCRLAADNVVSENVLVAERISAGEGIPTR